jgi:hypothetical protein
MGIAYLSRHFSPDIKSEIPSCIILSHSLYPSKLRLSAGASAVVWF